MTWVTAGSFQRKRVWPGGRRGRGVKRKEILEQNTVKRSLYRGRGRKKMKGYVMQMFQIAVFQASPLIKFNSLHWLILGFFYALFVQWSIIATIKKSIFFFIHVSDFLCILPLVASRQLDGKRPLPLKSLDNLEDFRASYQKTTVRVFDLDPCIRRVFHL